MADKIYEPETISDNPFPTEGESIGGGVTSSDINTPTTIKESGFPKRKVAHELLSSALNTVSRKILAEFEFTESGAIQIGKYTNGVLGDIRITPNGITARDLAGLITFAIDGETGNAVFKGEIQAGSVFSEGTIEGGTIIGGIIDGGSININDRFVVDELGSFSIGSGDYPNIMTVSYDEGFVSVRSLHVGQPVGSVGRIIMYDSNVEFARLDLDNGLLMGDGRPVTLTGDTVPSAPGAHGASLYVDAGGAGGKHRLLVRFGTGVSQLIATEP